TRHRPPHIAPGSWGGGRGTAPAPRRARRPGGYWRAGSYASDLLGSRAGCSINAAAYDCRNGEANAMAEERVERRLAAILAADVAGYSRLIGQDEEGTLSALRELRRELVEPCVAEHNGRVVKTTGDGLLIEFASTIDALRCASVVQREMAERTAGVPP